MPASRRRAPTERNQAFSKMNAWSEQETCRRKTRPHMRRQAQRAASIGEATPGASHGRLRIRSTLLQKKERRPAKAANRRSGEIQASPRPITDRLMPQRVVTKDEHGHRLDYRHGSR